MIKIREIPKGENVSKAMCPYCRKELHQIGLTKTSRCSDITTVCKFCKRTLVVDIDTS